MTTRRFGLLAFLGLLALSSTSEAQGIYLKTSGGVSFGSDKIIEKNYGTMPLFNIGIGIDCFQNSVFNIRFSTKWIN